MSGSDEESSHLSQKLSNDLKMADPGSDEDSASFAESFAESHRSKDYPLFFSMGERTREKRKSEGKSVTCLMSTESNRSKDYPLFFSPPDVPLETNGHTTPSSGQNLDTLEVFESKVMDFVKKALKIHKTVLSAKHKGLFEEDKQEDVVDGALKSDDETNEAALKIALHILRTMNQDEDANTLEQSHYGSLAIFQRKQRSSMKKKYECLLGVMHTQQWPVPLKKSYTKLCLIEGGTGAVNNEHEVRQIESTFNRQRTLETVISCEDIFKPLPKKEKIIRVVLTKGIAGIGKTVLAQKFMLDWSEEKANQDIQLLFSLPFRELNFLRNQRCSLMELLCDFSPDLKESGLRDLNLYKVVFILDGLDECRLQLDFRGNEKCYDASQMASVDVLLTNLIDGNLLPKASLWITTRPAAASCIPPQYVDRVTVIRGFNNLQKEQYFHKRFEDENLAKRVIASIKSTRSLYIMCHVPVFCWISSIVLGKMCAKTSGGKMPKTLTQMYIHFLTHQTNQMCAKYSEKQQLGSQENNRVIMSLGKLAFQQLEKGNLIFYEDDLRDCGIDVNEASVYSGVCTQVFREESWLQQKVFCFVHLSVQEFLAALYVHVMYKSSGVNLMTNQSEQVSRTKSVIELHKSAVDRALQSMNGHLDLFLRFLLGLSLESSHVLLTALQIELEPSDSKSHEEATEYIYKKLNMSLPPEKYINLFHCLNELNEHSMVKEIQNYLDSDRDELVMDGSSPARWAALVFVLLTSPEKPEEIQLKKYSRTAEGLIRLLPAIKASRSAMLNDCNLTADSCQMLSTTLSSSCNELKHLNFSDNNLEDSGIKLLCDGLQNQQCRLKTLRLNRCGLTQRCCEDLAFVLSCSSSHLQELDLSDNDIEDTGVQFLCTGLGNVSCKLEILRLSFCNITEKGCGFLASAVKSNPSHLRELDLSYNHLGESGKTLISDTLEEGHCEFIKLRIDHSAEHWLTSGLREYECELTLDRSTAHKLLVFSDGNQKVTWAEEEQPYPDHQERFDYWAQVLFQQGLNSRCYWEMEWEGSWAGIGVTYRGIDRKGPSNDCVIGYNKLSWSLHCSVHGYRAYHDYKSTVLQVPLAGSHRLAVYLDWKCGILSFYRVSSGRSLTHLHTFFNKFTEPVYPVFRVWGKGSSLKLCQVNSSESSEE